MIKGMTGFGSNQFSFADIKGVVEIKTLNHRYFDITYYLPIGFGSVEEKIKQLIQKSVDRGRVSVSVKLVHTQPTHLKFNKEVIKQYIEYGKKIGKEFGLKNDLSLSDIIKLPGVVDAGDHAADTDMAWPVVEKALKKALVSVVQMRRREGRSIGQDIQNQLKLMTAQIKQIQTRAKFILDEKAQLTAEEFMSFQKNNDINEELARLIHYVEEVKLLLKTDVAVGKKIDFIAQEMQRETNTIGSKLQDKLVSNAVIALKSKIEKIREQSQNIE